MYELSSRVTKVSIIMGIVPLSWNIPFSSVGTLVCRIWTSRITNAVINATIIHLFTIILPIRRSGLGRTIHSCKLWEFSPLKLNTAPGGQLISLNKSGIWNDFLQILGSSSPCENSPRLQDKGARFGRVVYQGWITPRKGPTYYRKCRI